MQTVPSHISLEDAINLLETNKAELLEIGKIPQLMLHLSGITHIYRIENISKPDYVLYVSFSQKSLNTLETPNLDYEDLY